MKQIAVPAVLLGALATRVVACDLCAVYSAAESRGEIGKGLYAGVAEQFTHFGTLQEDGHKVPNEANQWLDSSITQLLLGYNFNERVGVQFNLPLIHRSFSRPEGFETDRDTESGLGDSLLLGHLQVLRNESQDGTFTWNLLAGVKLPTGSSDRIAEELDEVEVPGAPESGIHGHDLALGSGSWDGLVGTSVYGRWQRAFATASVQYAIRSRGVVCRSASGSSRRTGGIWRKHASPSRPRPPPVGVRAAFNTEWRGPRRRRTARLRP